MLFSIAEAAILAASLSLDSFVAGFAYGSNKIKIPFSSVQIINIICSSAVALSIFVGSIIKNYIPPWLTVGLCFSILFIMGFVKLIEGIMKSFIRRHAGLKRRVEFSMFSLHFILTLYADPEESDVDKSKSISAMEAVSLSLALSLDGLAVGFGAAMGDANGLAVFLWSLLTNTAFILSGCYIGRKIARKVRFNFSWVSGAILIVMAFLKILPI
jgi:putative sporulation protein YtaF